MFHLSFTGFHWLCTRPTPTASCWGNFSSGLGEPKPKRRTEPKNETSNTFPNSNRSIQNPRRDETLRLSLFKTLPFARLSNSIRGELPMLLLHKSNQCSNKLPLGEVLNIKMPYVRKTTMKIQLNPL